MNLEDLFDMFGDKNFKKDVAVIEKLVHSICDQIEEHRETIDKKMIDAHKELCPGHVEGTACEEFFKQVMVNAVQIELQIRKEAHKMEQEYKFGNQN